MLDPQFFDDLGAKEMPNQFRRLPDLLSLCGYFHDLAFIDHTGTP
jgi:hypothetical protein